MTHVLTLREVEKLILADAPPLDFGSQMPTYRAAVRRLANLDIPSWRSLDPWRVPFTRYTLEEAFTENELSPSILSKTEKNGQNQWKTRLRNINRLLDGTVTGQTTPNWSRLKALVEADAKACGQDPLRYIPLTHSLKCIAIQCGLEPHEITHHWMSEEARKATTKRRKLLSQASKQLDELRDILPPDLKPTEYPIAPLSLAAGGQRKAGKLPPRIKITLDNYVNSRIVGTTAAGVNGPVTTQKGINSTETAPEYKNAFAWYRDCLQALKLLKADADPEINQFGNLTQLRVVVVESLADIDRARAGTPTAFPWHPIAPNTLDKRLSFLIKALSDLVKGFSRLKVSMSGGERHHDFISATGLLSLVRREVPKALTPQAEAFCRKIVTDRERRAVLLNFHMILWSEAQRRWADFEDQTLIEQCRTLNVCALSAMTAITTSFPFRRRTLVSLALEGEDPDVFLPKDNLQIIFDVSASKMKANEGFEGTLEDAGRNQPRRIIDWFISGPRRALLNHPMALSSSLKNSDLLFCGIPRERYANTLSEWAEELGIRMTSHLFRHAIASILINNLGCSLQHVAAILGNTTATIERNYLFLDKVKHRQHAVSLLDKAREAELPTILHARMRGKRS